MGAVRSRDDRGAAAVEALRAGCDLLLYCDELERAEAAVEALRRAADAVSAVRERLDEAAERVRATAVCWPASAPDPDSWATVPGAFDEFTGLRGASDDHSTGPA